MTTEMEVTKNKLMSDSITKIVGALLKVQKEVEPVTKNKANPYFKSRYADLSAVYETVRDLLTKNEIVVFQSGEDTGENGSIVLTTLLLHVSGEWLSSSFRVPLVKNDPQALGSAITYARRYGLTSAIGLSTEDDDAESAMGRVQKPAITHSTPSRSGTLVEPEKSAKDIERDKLIKTLYFLCCNEKKLGMKREEIAIYIKTVLEKDDIKSLNDVTNAELKKVIKFAEDEIKALEQLKKESGRQ